ncbi:uncharacterized protein LMH87_008422 [Akanthomyces muscarius]|uniref:Uncharacterized protein n=1 Tax=Akanthomyces muscarius TaxID=2231603 RepID=A0A9W8UQV8_AKAMU|nr:uncharacterized protein LMH87_008422 [Akanthomyces muscarius]KAJ4159524.1 hypothetical protein LMH87_008422 [Akanthomyces muscarius]
MSVVEGLFLFEYIALSIRHSSFWGWFSGRLCILPPRSIVFDPLVASGSPHCTVAAQFASPPTNRPTSFPPSYTLHDHSPSSAVARYPFASTSVSDCCNFAWFGCWNIAQTLFLLRLSLSVVLPISPILEPFGRLPLMY